MEDENRVPEEEIPLPEAANLLPEGEDRYEDQPTEEYENVIGEVSLKHNSHSFVHFSCMAFRKCRWCWEPIQLLRGAGKCQKCGIIVHHACQQVISKGCGVTEYLWDHYIYMTRDILPPSPCLDIQKLVCWVYQHSGEQSELRYLKFIYKTIYLYSVMPTENSHPDEFYPLGIPTIHTNIVTDVSGRFHGTNLDKYVSILFYISKECGVPCVTVTLEFLTDWDREIFLDAHSVQKSLGKALTQA